MIHVEWNTKTCASQQRVWRNLKHKTYKNRKQTNKCFSFQRISGWFSKNDFVQYLLKMFIYCNWFCIAWVFWYCATLQHVTSFVKLEISSLADGLFHPLKFNYILIYLVSYLFCFQLLQKDILRVALATIVHFNYCNTGIFA